MFTEKEKVLRQSKIRERLVSCKTDACLLSTSVNILYANGTIFNGYQYIPVDGETLLFVKRPAGMKGENIFYINKPEQIPAILRENGIKFPGRLMLEGGEIGYDQWIRIQACFPDTKLYNGTPDFRYVRSVKTNYEIQLIKKSAESHAIVHKRIPGLFRPGMTDIEFSIEIERQMRLEGNKGLLRTFGEIEAFMGSVLTGDNAAAPSPYDFALGGAGDPSNPVGANGSVLREGCSVMVDMCGNFTGYLDDITRTFSIGKLTEKAYNAHQVAIEIENRLQSEMKEGAKCADMWNIAEAIASKAGLSDCFMGTKQQAKFVGHGLGLVINEPPVLAGRSRETLERNMVIAVEPKFVIEGVGAVGLEDTYIVGENGSEKISDVEPEIIDLLEYRNYSSK